MEMDDEAREDYIAKGAAAATPDLPECPDDAFTTLDPVHRVWAWKAYNYALDLMDIHLAHIRIATMTGDIDRAQVVSRSLTTQMHQALGMLAFLEAMTIKAMTENPDTRAMDVVERMARMGEETGKYQLGDLVEALEAKGWTTYWLEMQEVDGD